MAGAFTEAEWKQINEVLDANDAKDPALNETEFGLPQRIYGSAVLASFNIRKLGSAHKRSGVTWEFLARLCRRFDLLAIQEVMDDLTGLERLRDLMGEEYGMIVSDKTGAFPGDAGLNERMAFLYRRSIVRRGPIVSDVTYDRSKVHQLLAENWEAVQPAMEQFADKLAEFEAGTRKTKPKLDIPLFLSFIRQPFTVSFEIVGHPEARRLRFMAVNAHLIFGETRDRKREFRALMEWIVAREGEINPDVRFPGLVLLGDLNLDFDSPERDIEDIQEYLNTIPSKAGDISVRFPFLEKHPTRGLIRTNARLSQTYDQLGFFYRESSFPKEVLEAKPGDSPVGPDYGVVDFVKLFSTTLNGGKNLDELSKPKRDELFKKFEHSVSDHMPIWLRLPLPK